MQKYLLAFFLLIGCLNPLSGATIIVGPPPASIQTAINSASPGDTIQLSAGTYIEQLQVISKSLTIVGTGQNTTTIQSPGPATPLTQFFISGQRTWPVVMIDNLALPVIQTVNLSDFTLDAGLQQNTSTLPPPSAGQYGFSDRFFGIGYHNASGTINNVHVTNTRSTTNFSQLAGGGIANFVDSGSATFAVTNCLVDFYQRNGIVGFGANLTVNFSNNTVNRGYVLTAGSTTASPNGITVVQCTGNVTNNTVLSNIATVLNASSTAINLSSAAANMTVQGNIITNNDLGIFATSCGNNLVIQSNTLDFNTTPAINDSEGIIVRDTNGLSILTSNIMNVPNFSMEILTINGTNQPFQLTNNQFNNSQVGLLIYGKTGTPSTGPIITMNSDSFTGTLGYYIQEVAAPNTAPNDVWPSTATVSFDGLVSGHITLAEYNQILTKIFDQHNDPTLGLVLDYIIPSPPTLTMISADFGPTTGGNTVTITGTGFISSNTAVYFGAIPGTSVVIISDTVITVTAPPGVGAVDVTVVTPFGVTPVVPAGQYTYIQMPLNPLPPTDFTGVITKCKYLNKTSCSLNSTWLPSPSQGVVSYRIYNHSKLVDEISALSTLSSFVCLNKCSGNAITITAVNENNLESTPLPIVLTKE